jgi:hypothetical protein
METDRNFPRLSAVNHRVTSPNSTSYNCVAWAAGDTEHWWQPGAFWPIASPAADFGIGVLVLAFSAMGFESCEDETFEAGFEKVALYGHHAFFTHAARQLPSGKWTSKLGKAEDIEHDSPDVVAGGLYGEVVEIMKRPTPAQ